MEPNKEGRPSRDRGRRSFLKKLFGATAGVLAAGVGFAHKSAPEEVLQPIDQPNVVQNTPKETLAPTPTLREAIPTGKKSEANDHQQWGINKEDTDANASVAKEAPDPYDFTEEDKAAIFDNARNLPDGDLMKEELLKQNAPKKS